MRGSKHAKGRESEPQPTAGTPKPPAWLCPEAKKVWRYTAGEMETSPGWLTTVDRDLLARYSQWMADFGRLVKEIRLEGEVLTFENHKGGEYVTRNPKTILLREADAQAHHAASELGITPASRSKVKAVPSKPKKDDPWESL